MSEYVDSDDRTTQEITFEVTAYIVADDGSPTPGESDVMQVLEEGLSGRGFQVRGVNASQM
jgi:hypothetical protein